MRLFPLVALAVACTDYNLEDQNKQDEPFDTGSEWEPPITDTEDSVPVDTEPPPDECPSPDDQPRSIAIDDTCETEPEVGTFTPIIEWANEEPGDAYTTPVIGNLTDDNGDGKVDEDDIPDAVIGNTSGTYWAVSGDDGRTLWHSTNSLGSEPMTAAIADLDSDGWPDVVGAGASGTAAWYGSDGSTMWTTSAYTGANSPQCGAVGVADLDGDGEVEVIIGDWILYGEDGSQRGKGGLGNGASHGWAAPIGYAADIDVDGEMEVVVGNALYDADGDVIWSNGEADGAVATGQFDGDDAAEIVVTRTGNVRLQDDDGSVIWELNGIAGTTVGTPTVADFDGDGGPEIGIAGMGNYTVLDEDGATLWQKTTKDFSSGFTGSAVFDFEGDGAAEVVYADEDDVWVFDGATGDVKLQESTHSSATCSEYPAVADVDGDGHAEIVYTSSAYSGTERGVRAIGDADNSWRAGSHAWNQHAYSITNVNDDSSIPKYADPNWLSYNNFRSGDLVAGTGGSLPDATLLLNETCITECDEGDLRLIVVVANAGTSDLEPGMMVTLYSYQYGSPYLISSTATTETVPPGGSTYGIEFHVDPAQIIDGRLEFRVDDDGKLMECHEDNNILTVVDGLCP